MTDFTPRVGGPVSNGDSSTSEAFTDYLDLVGEIVETHMTDADIEGRLHKLLRSTPTASPRRRRVERRVHRRARTAERLATYSARLLSRTAHLRLSHGYAEEFRAELEALAEAGAGRGTQIRYSLGLIGFALHMRLTFRSDPDDEAIVEHKIAKLREAYVERLTAT